MLEDLAIRGYYIKDIQQRLNYDECKLVFEKIGKFHGATTALHAKQPNVFRHHCQGNITEKFSPMHLLYRNSIESCIRVANETVELQQYVPKLKAFASEIVAKLIRMYAADDSFKTLNHGDLWVNNVMFSDTERDVILVRVETHFTFAIYFNCNIWLTFTHTHTG